MKKRVGIVTLTGGENYGNVLQNYAVQETINELGLSAETVKNLTRFGRFLPENEKVNKFTPKYIKTYILNQLNYRYNIKNSDKGILKTFLLCKKNNKQLSAAKKMRKTAFANFCDNYINWSKETLDINKSFANFKIGEKYDFFVAGSDQVWNPTYPSTSSINFLQFAPPHKRVCFSPSFGISEIPEVLKQDYSKWLSEIPHLSVREEQGRCIINDLTGRDATVLCDPTMCLTKEKWLSLASKPNFDTSKPYVLTYFLGDRTKKYDRYIEKIAKENNLVIINLFDVLDLEHYATSPQELIYLINNAKLVCTDSFHGTVFSIIMNTDFVTFSRNESGKSMHSRIDTLLSTFGLQERNYNTLSSENLFKTDFSDTDDILNKKREEVFEFLKKAFTIKVANFSEQPKKITVLDNKENCCGCGACVAVCPVNCITMQKDDEGFDYPHIDQSLCVNCQKCEKTCPAINENTPKNTVGDNCYIAYSLDPIVRKKSSSGGVFYHLASSVIAQGGVVFGAAMINKTVKHTFAKTQDELSMFMGSKYVQSDIGICYLNAKEFLDNGILVYFSGTPCQIKGLYAFLGKKEYSNLITQDLICHGVPSPMVWNKYSGFISNCENSDISFRDKHSGWHYFSMRIRDKKGVYRKTLDDDFYLKLFLDNTILRPSCYDCTAKKQGGSADITLADCWKPQSVCSNIKDDDKGLSLVLINSDNGHALWNDVSLQNQLYIKQVDSVNALASQSAISKSAPCNPKRAMFFSAFNKVDMQYLYKNWYRKSPIRALKQKIVYYKTKIKLFILK
ncbi:MAG: polysaccharide pyruvyl transferase family protein [Clostridia bacterium]|nr:polysaccharide pyruvyl transferase family protein [Clostridia bacterium]MBR3592478.1 polysaccharide pyruvyl transferase family protein [Clostridia bacterium]